MADGKLWFSNYADQRLYRFEPGEEPEPVTPEAELRYAGCALDAPRDRLICIREDHRGLGEPSNELVAIPTQEPGLHEGERLFSGTDFVSAPSLSPDGKRIAFTSWMHPNMPWDSTQLHSARFAEDGSLEALTLHNPGADESVVDPQWDSEGTLIALSDRDNWWRPYRIDGEEFVAVDTGSGGTGNRRTQTGRSAAATFIRNPMEACSRSRGAAASRCSIPWTVKAGTGSSTQAR